MSAQALLRRLQAASVAPNQLATTQLLLDAIAFIERQEEENARSWQSLMGQQQILSERGLARSPQEIYEAAVRAGAVESEGGP